MNKVMYREWYPAIMYNHHQTGPAGTVMFAPPFRDPFNYNFDPLIPLGIDMVGAAMHTRLAAGGQAGRDDALGRRTTRRGGTAACARRSYFHNQIGMLTETIGNPTPVEIPFVPDMQLPRADLPSPIAPQTWHFRQSIDYSVTANYAILDLASQRKEDFLFNIYQMAKNADRARQHAITGRSTRSGIEAAREAMRCGAGAARRAAARHRAARRRAAAVAAAAARRSRSTTACCTIRRCAIRAASSCRRISRTSRPRPSSSTR